MSDEVCGAVDEQTGMVCDRPLGKCFITHWTGEVSWGVSANLPKNEKGSKRKRMQDIIDNGINIQEPVGPPDLAEVFGNLPVIEYGDTSGWSGSETSEERARYMDRSGITADVQRKILAALTVVRETGITQGECDLYLDLKHGSASGALSGLHRRGYLARLTWVRNGSLVYVLPEYVNGRDHTIFKSKKEEQILEAKAIGWDSCHRLLCQGFRMREVCSHNNPYESELIEAASSGAVTT